MWVELNCIFSQEQEQESFQKFMENSIKSVLVQNFLNSSTGFFKSPKQPHVVVVTSIAHYGHLDTLKALTAQSTASASCLRSLVVTDPAYELFSKLPGPCNAQLCIGPTGLQLLPRVHCSVHSGI